MKENFVQLSKNMSSQCNFKKMRDTFCFKPYLRGNQCNLFMKIIKEKTSNSIGSDEVIDYLSTQTKSTSDMLGFKNQSTWIFS